MSLRARGPATFLTKAVVLALGRGLDGRGLPGLTPCLRAKPATACGGADFAGPMTRSSVSAWRSGKPFGAQHQPARRGVQRDRFVRNFQLLEQQAQVFERRRNHPIGNLFGADFEQEGRMQAHWATSAASRLLLIDPGLRHAHRQLAHALDDAHALGHADGAARIERIKEVGALQHLVVGRQQREALLVRRPSGRTASAAAPLRLRAARTASTAWRCRPSRSCRPSTAARPDSARRA